MTDTDTIASAAAYAHAQMDLAEHLHGLSRKSRGFDGAFLLSLARGIQETACDRLRAVEAAQPRERNAADINESAMWG